MTAAKEAPIEVQPGQVWADNDPRSAGRTLQIQALTESTALCLVLTNADADQARIDTYGNPGTTGRYLKKGEWVSGDRRGLSTTISLARFRPTATGYRLVSS